MATILVIDDESGIRYLLDTVFRRKGHTVLLAETGLKGLDLFRREQPDVTILDLKMPDMNGVEVLRQIRSLDRQKPVIVLTGAQIEGAEEEVRALGVSVLLEKEFSLHRLGDAVRKVLDVPHPTMRTSGNA